MGFLRVENKYYYKIDKRQDISAFTATELLEMLPKTLKIRESYYKIYIAVSGIDGETFEVRYLSLDEDIENLCKSDDNLLNALAKMLIYLIENQLIKL